MKHISAFCVLCLFIFSSVVDGCAPSQSDCKKGEFMSGKLIWTSKGKVVTFTYVAYFAPTWSSTGATFDVAYGDSTTDTLEYTVVEKTSTYIFTKTTFTHTYTTGLASYSPQIFTCCRIPGILGLSVPSDSTSYTLSAVVNLQGVTDDTQRASPDLGIFPVLEIGVGDVSLTLTSTLSTRMTFNRNSGHGYTNGAFVGTTGNVPTLTVIPTDDVATRNTAWKFAWTTVAGDKGLWSVQISLRSTFGGSTFEYLFKVTEVSVSQEALTLSFQDDKTSFTGLIYGDEVKSVITCTSTKPGANLQITVNTQNAPAGQVINLNGQVQTSVTVASGTAVSFSWKPEYDTATESYKLFSLPVKCLNVDSYISVSSQISAQVTKLLTVDPPPSIDVRCEDYKCNLYGCGVYSGIPTWSDGCCGDPWYRWKDPFDKWSDVNTSIKCHGSFTRTWIVTNNCGQEVTKEQTINVKDNTPPVWTRLPSITHDSCYSNIEEILSLDNPAADDACTSAKINFELSSTGGKSSCNNQVQVLYTATDDCGNAVNYLHNITINDDEKPTVYSYDSAKCPRVIQCPWQNETWANLVYAEDNCDRKLSVSYTDNPRMPNGCGKFVRTFTTTDKCGNVGSLSLDLTIYHPYPPTIDLKNEEKTPTCWDEVGCLQNPTAKSYCGYNLPVKQVGETTYRQEGRCITAILRNWTTCDECGYTTSALEVIKVRDNIPPKLVIPEDKVYECAPDLDTSPIKVGQATASDNCGEAVPIYKDVPAPGKCITVINRNWKTVDYCNNAVDRTQVITIRDRTPPTLNFVDKLTYQCIEDDTVPKPTSSDVCQGLITPTYVDDILSRSNLPGCHNRYIRRTWSADDGCGNINQQVQYVNITDTTPPTIQPPCDHEAECILKATPDYTGKLVNYHDNCGGGISAQPTYTDVTFPPGSQSPDRIERTWCVVDNCGNQACAKQIITVDNKKPNVTIPMDITVDCESQTSPNLTGIASANDDCNGTLPVTYTDRREGPCPTKIYRTWTVTNPFTGQTVSNVQVITVKSRFPPRLTVNPVETFSCFHEVNATKPTVQLYCPESTYSDKDLTYTDTRLNFPPGDFNILRQWQVKDECNVYGYVNQTIEIRDRIPPVITVPCDYKTTCRFNTQTNTTGYPNATDNCNRKIDENYVKVWFEDSASPYDCPKTIIRTWYAEDSSRNRISANQTLTIQEELPTFYGYLQTEWTIECEEDLKTIPNLTAKDSCGYEVKPVLKTTRSTDLCPIVYTQVWTATDNCGKIAVFERKIYVRDTKPPTLTLLSPRIDEQCEDLVGRVGYCSASDNCGGVMKPFFTDVSGDNCTCFDRCLKVINRYWSVRDACGNTAPPKLQQIFIQKTTPPTISVPGSRVLKCNSFSLSATGTAVATDICGKRLPVMYNDTIYNDTGATYIIKRYWWATDECGNTNGGWQTITVAPWDPIIHVPTQPISLPCGGDSSVKALGGAPAYEYNCGPWNLDLGYYDSTTCSGTPGQKVRWWTLKLRENGQIIKQVPQYIQYQPCEPVALQGEIKNIPSEPKTIGFELRPFVVVYDEDIPCEVITVVYYWGDGSFDTIRCDPNTLQQGCDFDFQAKTVRVTGYKKYNQPNSYVILALVYDSSADKATLPTQLAAGQHGTAWFVLNSGFVTFDAAAGNVNGDIYVAARTTWAPIYRKTTIPSNPYYLLYPRQGSVYVQFQAQFVTLDNLIIKPHGSLYVYYDSFRLAFRSVNISRLTMFAEDKVTKKRRARFEGFLTTNLIPTTEVAKFVAVCVDGNTGAADYSTDGDYFRLQVTSVSDGKILFDMANSSFALDLNYIESPFAVSGGGIKITNPPLTTLSFLQGESSKTSSGLSGGAIAGIVVGVVIFIVIVAVVLVLLLRQAGVPIGGKQDFSSPMNL